MSILKNGQAVKLYKGDFSPINLYKGNTKLGGYHTSSDSGTSVEFAKTYNDVAEVLVEGNTVQSSDYYAKDGLCSQYTDTKVMGKNLFDGVYIAGCLDAVNVGDTAHFIANASNICSKNGIKLSPNTTYYLKNYNGVADFRYWILDKNMIVLSTVNFSASGGVITTSSATEQYLYFREGIGHNDFSVGKAQLELGSIMNAYEPYKDIVKDNLKMELSGRNFFNNPPTTTLQDRSGNGNIGTATGFLYTATSGSDGNGGIELDGVDAKVECKGLPTTYLNVGGENQPITLDLWCKNNAINQGIAFGKIGFNTGLIVYNGSVKLSMWFGTNCYTASATIPNGTLTHIVGTINNGTLKLYINGSLVNTSVSGAGLSYRDIGTTPITLGGYSPWYGKLTVYSARLYDRELSASEIYQNYFAGINLNIPSPTDQSPVISNLKSGTYKYTSTDGIYEFTLADDLRGINGVMDKVVFDRVSHKGYLERRCGITVLNGVSMKCGWLETSMIGTGYIRGDFYSIPNYGGGVNSYCDRIKGSGGGYGKEGIEMSYYNAQYKLNLYLLASRLSTTDKSGMDTWLQTNPLTVVYPLLKPTRTPLTFTKVSSSAKTEAPMTFLTNTPSLNYPADVWSVEGNKGMSHGKNLCKTYYGDASKGLYMNTLLIDGYLKPNTSYTLSFEGVLGNRYYTNEFFQWGIIDVVQGRTVARFTTPSFIDMANTSHYTSGKGWIILKNHINQPNFNVFNNVQLVEGSVDYPYASYHDSTSNLPTLRKIGSVSDSYNPKSGVHTKNISDWFNLDGTLGWNLDSELNGCKKFMFTMTNVGRLGMGERTYHNTYKYDSKPIVDSSFTSIDYMVSNSYGVNNASYYLTVSDQDTGMGENIIPTNAEIKAYFYGWKMCNTDGTSPYYKSEVPYNPSTWAEWIKGNGVFCDSSGFELTINGEWQESMYPANIKPSTKYGFLYNVVSTQIVSNLCGDSSRTFNIYYPTTVGNQKVVATSLATITSNFISIQVSTRTEIIGKKIKIKDIRIFELPVGSQIESDFSTMTADQLCAKYTFNGLCTKNWVRVTDGLGQTATLPTASYEGYTPYKMLYQLATPIVTNLTPTPLQTFYPYTKIETDATVCKPTITSTVKVED